MGSEEDSFVQLPPPEDGVPAATPEQVRQEMERCKELCSALEQDNVKLQMAKEAVEQRTRELRKEGELLHKNLGQQMSLSRDEEKSCQVGISLAKEERNRLRQEKQVLEKKLEEVRKRVLWEDPVKVLPALPEKKMVFKGLVANKEDMNKLMLTPLIHYPLLGGSALITFEKAEVAQRIIEVKEHMVELSYGEELEELERCRVRVQAAPVDVLLPSALEVGPEGLLLPAPQRTTELPQARTSFALLCSAAPRARPCRVAGTGPAQCISAAALRCSPELWGRPCPALVLTGLCHPQIRLTRSSRSILVSDLPSLGIPEESLLDKLELFFSKTKNGGGEVESREFLDSSGQVVLTFVQDGVAEPLIERGRIQVLIGKGKYELKISPCMSGDITNLQGPLRLTPGSAQLQPSRCPRTVLLSGIPDVLGEEPMRDTLEIHFQKASRGGGEVDALAYVPAGRHGVAVFMEDAG
ncbi:hypothetical protein QYF61_020147 [Mycteria americana]|uniref:NID domain-containing protein n=1 Tax=Mycteria americana TaxID=33587 RepID=A0AAN7NDW7_MYCAM|nr:hypothetical protein QYF61_020147 [Mycteria americana]